MTTGEKLRVWREAKGLSQVKAAAMTGNVQKTWSGWETGRSAPDIDNAHRIESLTEGEIKVLDWVDPEKREKRDGAVAAALESSTSVDASAKAAG